MITLTRLAAPAALLLGFTAPLAAQTGPGPAASSTLFTAMQGADVQGAGAARVATLEDVIVDSQGRIVEVVLGEGGLFGIGKKLHLLDAGQFRGLGGGPIAAADLSAAQIAALPIYDADDPPDSVGPASAAPAAGRKPAPSGQARLPTPAAETAVAAGATPVQGETSSAGSGAGGMAPQQGTGTGATQIAPGANEAGATRPDGNPAVTQEQARLNAEYGREQLPTGAAMGRDNADAAMPGGLPPAVSPAGAAGPAAAPGRWRLGALVDAEVKGPDDGIEIEDFRIADGRVVDVVLSKSIDAASEDRRAVSFEALVIGGEPDDPDVALAPSASGRLVTPVPEAVAR